METFFVNVDRVEGNDVTLTVRPVIGGAGLTDYARTRSFVLMFAEEQGLLPASVEQVLDESWVKAHIDDFVSAIAIERYEGIFDEAQLLEAANNACMPVEWLQPRVQLRATLAKPELAHGFASLLQSRTERGTTAYDVWRNDERTPKLTGAAALRPRYDAELDLVDALNRGLPARLPAFQFAPVPGLHRVGDGVSLHVHVAQGRHSYRNGISLRIRIEVPELASLPKGAKTGQSVPRNVIGAEIYGPRSVAWFREWGRTEAGSIELEHPVLREVDALRETVDDFCERVAESLRHPALDTILTRAGLLAFFESNLERVPPKVRPASFVRLGEPTSAAALPDNWRFAWAEPDAFWQRVALHAALGSTEDARRALEQALSRWKKPPATHRALIEKLQS